MKQDALANIIFHAVPRAWLEAGGPWVLERGEGAILFDADGREYLDALAGGLFAVLTGYGRKEIADAMAEQAVRLNYTNPYAATSEVAVELANKLASLTPGDLDVSYFCSSGSEAVEAAIKLAHHYHAANGESHRHKVVSLRRAYHGSTVGALSATGWSPGFGEFRRSASPTVPAIGYVNAMPPYCRRCELGLSFPECNLACATSVEQAILGSDPELVSCVILEPIMGTAGCIIPPQGYLAAVREICDRYGVLLIADEVVCGFGRTGEWFGVNHSGVTPDIMTVAKGLGGGYAPIAAAVASREVAARIPVFFDVHTYGGHPVSAAAALTNLEIIEGEDLVANSAAIGEYMLDMLEGLRRHPIVGDVRGRGLFMALELSPEMANMAIDNQVAGITQAMGLLVRPLGGTIVLAPPLIYTREQAERTVEILDAALSRVGAERAPSGRADG